MKLWIRSYALECPKPADAPEEHAVVRNSNGSLNYGDDNAGEVVSAQPGGFLGTRANGTLGEWEQEHDASGINLAIFKVDGLTYGFPIRER